MSIWRTLLMVWLLAAPAAFASTPKAGGDGARQIWQLLDYVAVDYGGAVENGALASASEYAEMVDFAARAQQQLQSLPPHAGKAAIASAIGKLRTAIGTRASATDVARLAQEANRLLLAAYPFPIAPPLRPSLARGAELYARHCIACHGERGGGDGPLAATLNPAPTALNDPVRAKLRSLGALYQIVSLGVPGTAMPAFKELPAQDRWALAFFAGTLPYDQAMAQRGEQLWRQGRPVTPQRVPDLATLSQLSESALAQEVGDAAAQALTAYLRRQPAAIQSGQPEGLALARQLLDASRAALHGGDRAAALRLALSAYLDGVEPAEPVLAARSKSLLAALESAMLAYRSALTAGDLAQADASAAQLSELIDQAEAASSATRATPLATFLGALAILLREGLEALLIVVAMIACLKKAGQEQALPFVHAGWASALLAGLITWAVATWLVAFSGASRELTEGLGSLLAAAVLLSVGMWLHRKSSAGRWQHFIDTTLAAALSRRSAWALFGLAFLAVYREVFETVLFYSALLADGNGTALLAGFASAAALLAAASFVLLRTSTRLPIRQFFALTSVVVAVLAVVLAGKGIAALQEAGWVGVRLVAGPRLEMLGLYPTLQTMLAQSAVALAALAAIMFNRRPASERGTASS